MVTGPVVETMPDTPSAGSPAMVAADMALRFARVSVTVTIEPLGAVTVMFAASRSAASLAMSATLVSLA